jgi:hypothetical protein
VGGVQEGPWSARDRGVAAAQYFGVELKILHGSPSKH